MSAAIRVNLGPVEDQPIPLAVLYKLLSQRLPEESISHRKMPTWEQHTAFVRSRPYALWKLVLVSDGLGLRAVGAVYMTHRRELGVAILRGERRKGYAEAALRALRRIAGPGTMLANINPENGASLRLFAKLGGRTIQHTMEVPPEE